MTDDLIIKIGLSLFGAFATVVASVSTFLLNRRARAADKLEARIETLGQDLRQVMVEQVRLGCRVDTMEKDVHAAHQKIREIES